MSRTYFHGLKDVRGIEVQLYFYLFIFPGPLEWFTLAFDMPWMLILTDIRQGAFYAMLMSFWIIFAGEHIMVHCFLFFSRW